MTDTPSSLGAALIALRWAKPKRAYTCAQCSTVFQSTPQRKDVQPRYCGKSCRQRAWRERRKE